VVAFARKVSIPVIRRFSFRARLWKAAHSCVRLITVSVIDRLRACRNRSTPQPAILAFVASFAN